MAAKMQFQSAVEFTWPSVQITEYYEPMGSGQMEFHLSATEPVKDLVIVFPDGRHLKFARCFLRIKGVVEPEVDKNGIITFYRVMDDDVTPSLEV